jgi:hypothetical protein
MTTKTYLIDKIKQLIDLNEKNINFEVEFHIQSKDGSPFEFSITDEDQLDKKLNYQKSVHGIGYGKFLYDKNKYLNHFLVLKSDNKCECQVKINRTELPLKENLEIEKTNSTLTPSTSNSDYKKYILYGIIILVVIIIIFYFFKIYKPKNVEQGVRSTVQSTVQPPTLESQKSPQKSFLERLKNMNLSN